MKHKIESVEIKWRRSVNHCTSLEHVRKQLRIKSIQNKRDECRQNWVNLLNRMTDDRILKYCINLKGSETEEDPREDGISTIRNLIAYVQHDVKNKKEGRTRTPYLRAYHDPLIIIQ
jgi:hypothetical protein